MLCQLSTNCQDSCCVMSVTLINAGLQQKPWARIQQRLACVPIEDSDQTVHMHRLTRVFDGCYMGSQGSSISSAGNQDWSDCADAQTDLNLRCTHMPTCTLCWIPASSSVRNQLIQVTIFKRGYILVHKVIAIWGYNSAPLTLSMLVSTFFICWLHMQTVWTQIRPDKKSGLIWIQTVWHWWYSWKIFFNFNNKINQQMTKMLQITRHAKS